MLLIVNLGSYSEKYLHTFTDIDIMIKSIVGNQILVFRVSSIDLLLLESASFAKDMGLAYAEDSISTFRQVFVSETCQTFWDQSLEATSSALY